MKWPDQTGTIYTKLFFKHYLTTYKIETSPDQTINPTGSFYTESYSVGFIVSIHYISFSVVLKEKSQYIIEISPYQQPEKQEHAYHLRIFHEFITGLTAGYNLIDKE